MCISSMAINKPSQNILISQEKEPVRLRRLKSLQVLGLQSAIWTTELTMPYCNKAISFDNHSRANGLNFIWVDNMY